MTVTDAFLTGIVIGIIASWLIDEIFVEIIRWRNKE